MNSKDFLGEETTRVRQSGGLFWFLSREERELSG